MYVVHAQSLESDSKDCACTAKSVNYLKALGNLQILHEFGAQLSHFRFSFGYGVQAFTLAIN